MVRRMPVAALLLAMSMVVAGCQFLGRPEVTCRDVDPVTCQHLAAALLEEARQDQPGKQVVKLTITGEAGTYEMEFSDGTGQAVVGH